jgi:hypothetical protein
MLTRLRSALRTLFQGARFRQELDEEIAFHIERHTEDLIRSGVDPAEARRQARLRFGSVDEVKSRSREVRGLALIDEALRNVRFALRVMARNPLFTVTFVLTLGLCIGAGTAVYSVVDAVLWRPLPYPTPDRLALVVTYHPVTGVLPGFNAVDGGSWERIRDNADGFERAVFSDWPAGVNLLAELLPHAGRRAAHRSRVRGGRGHTRRPVVGHPESRTLGTDFRQRPGDRGPDDPIEG